MRHVEQWLTESPYCQALGIECAAIDSDRCLLSLPFRAANANQSGVLHGGVAASLSACVGQAVARSVFGQASGPWHTADIQLNYLAAATNETLQAEGRLLRNGKDLCYAGIEIRGGGDKLIASAIVLVRGRFGATLAALPDRRINVPASGPAPMGGRILNSAFIAARGMRMTYQQNGECHIAMPWLETNGELGGGVHERAALALLDTAGAMAAFALTGFAAGRASTPSIQAQVFTPIPAVGLEAHARRVPGRRHVLDRCRDLQHPRRPCLRAGYRRLPDRSGQIERTMQGSFAEDNHGPAVQRQVPLPSGRGSQLHKGVSPPLSTNRWRT